MSDYIIHNGELYHYGVKGMKWGHRRSARQTYRTAKNTAFSKYEREINDIEKGYKRGQMLSKKDQAREARAESNYQKAVSKAKSDYKQTVKRDKEIEKKASKEYNARTALSKKQKAIRAGATVATALLVSPVGAAGVAYGSTAFMRAHNDVKKKAKGKSYVDDILRSL